MEILKQHLDNLLEQLEQEKREEIMQRLDDLFSVYPFNEFEFLIATLMGNNIILLNDYYDLRDEYLARNMYLHLFEMTSPRGFGESWAQGHLKEITPELVKPTKKLDSSYSGQYDFLLDNIKIEVKASRAVDFNSQEALYVKALASSSEKRFDMNFQQVKPACADVFIWIGVWRDVIRYWVLASNEIANNKYYSTGQHRGNTGEGQIHLKDDNISSFAAFETSPRDLLEKIRQAHQRQHQKTRGKKNL